MNKLIVGVLSVASLLATVQASFADVIEVCPQAFDPGGWKLDVQFMDVVGSPYLLAHGCGIRVADAKASVTVPESGNWRVWVRSRRWVEGGVGRFGVSVGGVRLAKTFGADSSKWSWEDGGEVRLEKGNCTVVLSDADGFDGRCAGVVLTNDGARPEAALGIDRLPVSVESNFDLVVVGGGMPGTCAAVAAARRGLRVALVQDRPVLGGNASSEIRVWCAGEARYPLVRELRGWFMNRDGNNALSDANRMRLVEDESTLTTFLRHRVFAAETTGTNRKIVSIKALDWEHNRVVRLKAPLFCDATGDGWLGFYAGADWRMGREAASDHGETYAPVNADDHTLGASLMWTSAQANTDIPFSAPWAERYACGEVSTCGEWNWEYGIRRDMIAEAEEIRDRLLLAIYGSFSLAKKDPVNSRRVLDFVPFLLGKRESRRIMGDWIYSEKDVTEHRQFEDAIASGSWSIDLHYDDCKPGVDFLTTCRQPHYGRYWVPYRSIYSRNVGNLFVVGRCFSCTHVGLAGPRVINTLSQMGCAAGEAAAMCLKYGVLPRDIYTSGRCRELQRILGGDFPGNPDPDKANWLIVDDESEGVKIGKGWRLQYNPNGEQVGHWSHFREKDAENVVYPLPIGKGGRYAIMGRIPYLPFITPDSATTLVITSGTNQRTLVVNQAVNCGSWVKLSEMSIEPGATLTVVGGKSHGTVVADGFALVPLDE